MDKGPQYKNLSLYLSSKVRGVLYKNRYISDLL